MSVSLFPRFVLALFGMALLTVAHAAPKESAEVDPEDASAILRMESELSTVIKEDPQLPASYPLGKQEDVFGLGLKNYVVKGEETLLDVARVYDLGYNEIELTNPEIDPWIPAAGDLVRLPLRWILPAVAEKSGLFINLPEMRLYLRRSNGTVITHPVGIGQEGRDTPLGKASVTRKTPNPTWYVPKTILKETPDHEKVVPPGPDNPLGSHALYLSFTTYLIHGTNMPYGVGRRVSSGCIRLYPEDIIKLYPNVPVGETVVIVNQPVKVGWQGDELLIQIHPPLPDRGNDNLPKQASEAVAKALARRPEVKVALDWEQVDWWISLPDGLPHPIGHVYRGTPIAANPAPQLATEQKNLERKLAPTEVGRKEIKGLPLPPPEKKVSR